MNITKEELVDLFFSIKCCSGSAHHTEEVVKFANKYELTGSLRELIDYQNTQSNKDHELEVLKHDMRKAQIELLKLEIPEDDIASWILDNFVRKPKA